MTSKIKVDNIHKVSDDSVIIKKCGSTTTIGSGSGQTIVVDGATVTLGRCGGSVNVASGASTTGMGRTGTVNWCTTAKTSPFTAVSGNGYFINTTGGVVTVTLPASPTAGQIVAFSDYANKWGTNKVTLCRNSSNINGGAYNSDLTTVGSSITMLYVDGTRGWKQVNDATENVSGAPAFINATGGNAVVTCGDYKTHIFTGSGTFAVSSAPTPGNNNADYFVIAGGGSNTIPYSGGGGAGGFRMSNGFGLPVKSPLANPTGVVISAISYPVSVGAGGSAPAGSGTVSTFSSITSAGGGYGGSNQSGTMTGANGGSGGAGRTGGSGNTPPVSPPQGNNGGNSPPGVNAQGGGGGAAAAGITGGPPSTNAGNGGHGSYLGDAFIGPTAPSYGTPGPVSSSRYFAGGGGGGSDVNMPSYMGGYGGGGDGRPPQPATAKAGAVNTGGGAGGTPGGDFNGGSGIVMIRYKYQ